MVSSWSGVACLVAESCSTVGGRVITKKTESKESEANEQSLFLYNGCDGGVGCPPNGFSMSPRTSSLQLDATNHPPTHHKIHNKQFVSAALVVVDA